jgi:hypothetical protein
MEAFVKVQSLILCLLFTVNLGCRTRKFSAINAWEQEGERKAAVATIVGISKELYSRNYKLASSKNGVSDAEFDVLANQFANEILADSSQRSTVHSSGMAKKPLGSMVLEDHYYEYKNSPNVDSKNAFSSEIEILLAAKFNWSEWIQGNETLKLLAVQ